MKAKASAIALAAALAERGTPIVAAGFRVVEAATVVSAISVGRIHMDRGIGIEGSRGIERRRCVSQALGGVVELEDLSVATADGPCQHGPPG
jgi:hypothetical protein